MKPEQVLKAAKLIRTGEVIELGQVLDPATMAFFPGRQLSILTKRTNVLPQSNRRISNEEMVIGELGQIGTQFDGFSHQGIDNAFYNCFQQDQIATRNGFTKLDRERRRMMTRGILIDVAALKESKCNGIRSYSRTIEAERCDRIHGRPDRGSLIRWGHLMNPESGVLYGGL